MIAGNMDEHDKINLYNGYDYYDDNNKTPHIRTITKKKKKGFIVN